ncbi:hypothetical protein Tco_0884326, partial [Tanacetum coccineum]
MSLQFKIQTKWCPDSHWIWVVSEVVVPAEDWCLPHTACTNCVFGIPPDICHSPNTVLMNSSSKNNVGGMMHISCTECQKADVTPIVDSVIPRLLLKAKSAVSKMLFPEVMTSYRSETTDTILSNTPLVVAKALDDATRRAFEEEKRNIASQKRATQTTSINKLSAGRSSVSTATTPYVSVVSTPTGANAGESSFVYLGGKIPIDASTLPNADLPINPNMPDLEDDSGAFSNDDIFNGAYDNENVGAVADFNNMDDTINVSLIPTLRIHKDHPKDQILGDPKSAVQTRGKIQKASSAQQALVSYISKQNRTNHKDHQNCLLACFLSQEEPKNISQALQDESWVEAMQEELLQFKLQKVWILVDLPSGKKAIGTKWV